MEKTKLRFRADGTFKILQLTDMHLYGSEQYDSPAIEGSLELIRREAPDLIAFTGDICCDGEHDELRKNLDAYLTRVDEFGIPYTYTLGNHESDNSEMVPGRRDIVAEVLSAHPLSLFEAGDRDLGVGNYSVPVYSAEGEKQAWALYHLDCHSGYQYEFTPGKFDRNNPLITYEQRCWLESTHKALQARTGSVPAILFDHVPLREFNDLWMFDGTYGDHGEMVCCPSMGDGVFEMLLRLGDFKGVFAGHDHTNSYQGTFLGMTLAYGRCSGNFRWALWPYYHALQAEAVRHPAEGESPYEDHFPRGGRVILLDEKTNTLDTWVSLYNGESGKGHYTPPYFNRWDYFIPVNGQTNSDRIIPNTDIERDTSGGAEYAVFGP